MSNPADLFIPFPHPALASGSTSTSGSGKKGKILQSQSQPQSRGTSRSNSPAFPLERDPSTTASSGLITTTTTTSGSRTVEEDEQIALDRANRWAEEKYWRVQPGGREEKEGKRGKVALAGYLGYSVVGYTITPARPGVIPPNPFYPPYQNQVSTSTLAQSQSSSHEMRDSAGSVPFPEYDPRWASGRKGVKQIGRLHLVVDDSSVHGLTASQTPLLQTWDLISLQPVTPEAFSKACTELTRPGANQVGIITVPTNASRLPFKGMKRSLVRAALRHGAVFEICYASALGSRGDEKARQNFLTNAREAVRVIMAVSGGGGRDGVDRRGKGGGGIIFSSGDGEGVRGPADLINLATLLGMPANQAKEAVMETPLKVILRAHARRAYKGVLSVPRMVMPAVVDDSESTSKRKASEGQVADRSKKVKAA